MVLKLIRLCKIMQVETFCKCLLFFILMLVSQYSLMLIVQNANRLYDFLN